MEENTLKNAQFRKNLGMGILNSFNSANDMVKLENEMAPKKGKKGKKDSLEARWDYWQDRFLVKYVDTYTKLTAGLGVNYKVEDSITKLKATKTLDQLRSAWMLLSEDERRDGEVIAIKEELKKRYETA